MGKTDEGNIRLERLGSSAQVEELASDSSGKERHLSHCVVMKKLVKMFSVKNKLEGKGI